MKQRDEEMIKTSGRLTRLPGKSAINFNHSYLKDKAHVLASLNPKAVTLDPSDSMQILWQILLPSSRKFFSQRIINSIWMKENFHIERKKIAENVCLPLICFFCPPKLVRVSGNFSIFHPRCQKNHFANLNFFERRKKFTFLNSIRSHNPDCTCFPHIELGLMEEMQMRICAI